MNYVHLLRGEKQKHPKTIGYLILLTTMRIYINFTQYIHWLNERMPYECKMIMNIDNIEINVTPQGERGHNSLETQNGLWVPNYAA